MKTFLIFELPPPPSGTTGLASGVVEASDMPTPPEPLASPATLPPPESFEPPWAFPPLDPFDPPDALLLPAISKRSPPPPLVAEEPPDPVCAGELSPQPVSATSIHPDAQENKVRVRFMFDLAC